MNMTKIVTLTTDWHYSDYYIGAVKATIISSYADTIFVDISHNIIPHNWQQAGFVLKSIIDNFPAETIHVIGVDSEPINGIGIIVAKYRNQYFIGNDNGIFGIIFNAEPEIVISINLQDKLEECCFAEKNIFSEIVKFIFSGGNIKELGTIKEDVLRYTEAEAQITEKGIRGSVIYIDSYGNAITNIKREDFLRLTIGHEFEILLNTHHHKTNKINKSYNEVELANIVCIFNSLGLLEVALRGANAKELLGLYIDSQIRVVIK